MSLSGVETIALQNYGIIKGRVSNDILTLLKQEIFEIKNDFKKGIPHNKDLAGHITKEFLLPKSYDIIEPIAVDLALQYHEKYNYKDANLNILDNKSYKFQLESLWVNFQQKYEFNPIHRHAGMYSFVIWVEVPYFLNFEHSIGPGKLSSKNRAGMFEFTYTDILGQIRGEYIAVDKTYEGDIVLFPAALHHMVHPFYSSEKYRISVAGNIVAVIDD